MGQGVLRLPAYVLEPYKSLQSTSMSGDPTCFSASTSVSQGLAFYPLYTWFPHSPRPCSIPCHSSPFPLLVLLFPKELEMTRPRTRRVSPAFTDLETSSKEPRDLGAGRGVLLCASCIPFELGPTFHWVLVISINLCLPSPSWRQVIIAWVSSFPVAISRALPWRKMCFSDC